MGDRPGTPGSGDPTLVGIVLAGGRSSRFGDDDKLAAELRGRPLLHHAVMAIASVCDEVIVVVAANDAVPPPLPEDAVVTVRSARDRIAGAGPLAGLAAGLEATNAELVLVAGGDQPHLSLALLDLLAASIRDADAVVLADGERPRPLPSVLRRTPALTAALARLTGDRRSLRGLVADLDPVVVPERTWRRIDPDGLWRRDIDVPDDLGARD